MYCQNRVCCIACEKAILDGDAGSIADAQYWNVRCQDVLDQRLLQHHLGAAADGDDAAAAAAGIWLALMTLGLKLDAFEAAGP